MFPVKLSTALDVVFFAHDANGDAVTGKVDGDFTKRISKAGAAFAAMTVTITEREAGWYHLQLSAAHTDTVGVLTVYLTASGVKQVNLQWRVSDRILDDLARPADILVTPGQPIATEGDGMVRADLKEWNGTAPSNLVAGRLVSDGLIRTGTLAAGGASTATLDAGGSAVDDYYVGAYLALLAGTGAEQAPRLIIDYDGTTKVATLESAWATNPDATSTYAIFGCGAADLRRWRATQPSVLVSGRVDAHVGAMAAAVLTETAIAADAITAAKIAADAIGASELAQAAADKVWSTATRALTDKVGFALATSEHDAIVDKAWDEARSAHVAAGSFGEGAASVQGNVTGSVAALGAQAKADVNAEVDTALNTAIPGVPLGDSVNERLKSLDDAYTVARAAKLDQLDAAVSSRAAPGAAMTLAADAVTAAALASDASDEIAAKLLDLTDSIETGLTLRQAVRVVAAACAGKASGLATTTAVYRNAAADSKNRITATVDADGNRTAVTLDVA